MNRKTSELDANNGTTRYTYDLLGNLTSITDAAGEKTTFVYDDLGRLLQTQDALIETPTDKTDQVLLYDEAGNVLLTQDRSGKQRRYTYDKLNRKTKVEYLQDNTQDSYTFDGFGDLTQVANDDVTYRYTYTARHEMSSKTDNRLNKSLQWRYDPVGDLQTKTDYQGAVTKYQYDSSNRLVAEQNPAYLQVSYHYDPAGRLIDRLLSNGAQTVYHYDGDGRLQELKNLSATGTVVSDVTYTHDNIGTITKTVDSVGAKTVNYGYGNDGLYRLQSVNSTTASENRNYSYDAVGNRKTMVQGTTTYYYSYNPTGYSAAALDNRLVNIRTGSGTGPLYRQFQYDDSGRLLAKKDGSGTALYTVTYNGKGLPSQITAGTQTDTYSYDPNDYRIDKADSQGNRLYHLEGEHLEASYSTSGVLQDSYLRGAVIDEIVNGYHYNSNKPGDKVNYTYHHDQVNSVTALTTASGTTAEKTTFDAFGAPLNLTVPGTSNRLLFTGREYDRDTQLYYYRARYYDPEIGRFISEDPKGFAAGVNFYAYCSNSPINCNDPSGNVALVDNLVGAGIAASVDLGAQYYQSYKSGVPFNVDYTRLSVATGMGFVTSGVSSFWGEGVTAAGYGAATSFAVRTAGNTAIGAAASAGQTAALNQMEGTGNSVGSAALWGGAFGGFGSVVGDAFPAISAASRQGAIDSMSVSTYNLNYEIAKTTAGGSAMDIIRVGGPSPAAVTFGQQMGNVVGSLSAFAPENSAAAGGYVIYPNAPNTNMMQSVYHK